MYGHISLLMIQDISYLTEVKVTKLSKIITQLEKTNRSLFRKACLTSDEMSIFSSSSSSPISTSPISSPISIHYMDCYTH